MLELALAQYGVANRCVRRLAAVGRNHHGKMESPGGDFAAALPVWTVQAWRWAAVVRGMAVDHDVGLVLRVRWVCLGGLGGG